MCLLEIRAARAIRDHLLTLMHIVVSCLLKQWLLELLLIEFTRVFAHFNQHLNRGPNLRLFDKLTVTFDTNLLDQKLDESSLNCLPLDDMVLELAVLHVLDKRQVEFGDVVLVHV